MSILPWQQQNWTHLCSYSSQNRIPQALLITGQKGLGKHQLAEQFAHSLLCSSPAANGLACGHCHSCLLLSAGTHPDLLYLKPEEEKTTIAVDQIRSLIVHTQLKPQYEAYRAVIINPADLMNTNAANAFLKCLEEPTERTVMILITDKPAKLPATIVSRCQKLVLSVPEKTVFFSWLKQQGIQNDLEVLYSLAQGSPLLALDYAKSDAISQRKQSFETWLALAKKRAYPVVVAENWQKLPENALLFWMTSWIIDLIKCANLSQADNLYNPDLFNDLQVLAQKLDQKSLYKLYDLLLLSRQRLETQINKQTLLEEILIQWSELNWSK